MNSQVIHAATPPLRPRPAILSRSFFMSGFAIIAYIMFIHISLRFCTALTGEQFWTVGKPSEVLAALGGEGVMIFLVLIAVVWILLCETMGRRRLIRELRRQLEERG